MSRSDKALERLKSRPQDFTWAELQTIMRRLGYAEIRGSGSRRKFVNRTTLAILSLHEPHPRPFLKRYAIQEVLDHLTTWNLI